MQVEDKIAECTLILTKKSGRDLGVVFLDTGPCAA